MLLIIKENKEKEVKKRKEGQWNIITNIIIYRLQMTAFISNHQSMNS